MRALSQGRTPRLIGLFLMGETTINKFNYLWPISNGREHDYYSCQFWSMNMKRTNYLGVILWMDRVCKYHPYSWWCIVKAREGGRGRRWTPPPCLQCPSVLHQEGSSIAIDEWSTGAARSSNSPTNDEDGCIKVSFNSDQTIWRLKVVIDDEYAMWPLICCLNEGVKSEENTRQ